MLGVDKPGSQLTFSSFDVLHSGKSLMGSLFGGLKAKSDIPILLRRYVDKVTLLFYSYLYHIFPSFALNPRLIGKHFCIIITHMKLCSNSRQVVLFIYLCLES